MKNSTKPIEMLDHHKYRWHNCEADSWATLLHALPVQTFRKKVIEPSLSGIDEEVEEYSKLTTIDGKYRKYEVLKLRHVTIQSFCLSVHSLFEKGVRDWLAQYIYQARGRAPNLLTTLNVEIEALETRAANDTLWKLKDLSHKLRGLRLNSLPSYRVLCLLETLANACRHGQGQSADRLFELRPELWSARLRDVSAKCGRTPGFSAIKIPDSLLFDFCDAIVAFWNDLDIIRRLNEAEPGRLTTAATSHVDIAVKQSQAYVDKLRLNPWFNGVGPVPDQIDDDVKPDAV